jgi:hypothetical protein
MLSSAAHPKKKSELKGLEFSAYWNALGIRKHFFASFSNLLKTSKLPRILIL